MDPNDFPPAICGVSCDLKLDGIRLATDLSDVRQQVPAFGTATISVTVYASIFDLVRSVSQLLQRVGHQHGPAKPILIN